jgi:hypothetical protein
MLDRLLLLSVLTANSALAAPVTLNHSGRLLNQAGTPIDGQANLQFTLWDDESGGSSIHSEAIQVLASDGFYAVTLGTTGDLDASEVGTTGLWLEILVGTQSLGRSPVGFVPLAAIADSVIGGIADVTEVSINGVTVLDANRDLSVRDIAATAISADSLTLNGEAVSATPSVIGQLTRITAKATIAGSSHTLGVNPATVYGNTSCPAGTSLINWGTAEEVQYWGQTTHWYARCRNEGGALQAQLYTQYGYGGHYLICWGICAAN